MKRNKKRHTFTEKQKRKDCICKDKVPAWYRKMFNREKEAKAKQTLGRIIKGYDVEFEPEVKDVGWYWW